MDEAIEVVEAHLSLARLALAAVGSKLYSREEADAMRRLAAGACTALESLLTDLRRRRRGATKLGRFKDVVRGK